MEDGEKKTCEKVFHRGIELRLLGPRVATRLSMRLSPSSAILASSYLPQGAVPTPCINIACDTESAMKPNRAYSPNLVE